jgi:hypothetical protein
VTKFYIAGRPSRLAEYTAAAADLHRLGHDVIARWLWESEDTEAHGGPPLEYGSPFANSLAQRDYDDIDQVDVVINFTQDRGSLQRGGGRFVEVGYAVGKGKPVITVGPIENLFLGLTQVFEDWPAALRSLANKT